MVRTTLKRIAALALVLAFLAGPVLAERYKGFPRGHALITASELKSMLESPGPKPVVLAAVGKLSWLAGRIPGAYHAPRRSYTDREGMAVSRKQFQRFARRHGIDESSQVVVYDEKYDAARLWWLFFLYGKTDVRLLDGGMAAWREAGHGVDRGFGRSPPGGGRFVASPALDGWVADIEDVAEAATDGIPIWDTRDLPEWNGASIGG
ncbi:MAG: rhodanese-like domain-containing protein, partial [Boseongicola sp.]|nr:rhodanese-like domain-containing protein [Boseongicola sp.]